MDEGPHSRAASRVRGSAVTLNARATSRGTMALALSLLIFSVFMCEGLSSAASGAAAAPSVPTTSSSVAAQRESVLWRDGREAFSSTGALLAYIDEGNAGAFDGLLPHPPNQHVSFLCFAHTPFAAGTGKSSLRGGGDLFLHSQARVSCAWCGPRQTATPRNDVEPFPLHRVAAFRAQGWGVQVSGGAGASAEKCSTDLTRDFHVVQ
jgi:hypothetical protein